MAVTMATGLGGMSRQLVPPRRPLRPVACVLAVTLPFLSGGDLAGGGRRRAEVGAEKAAGHGPREFTALRDFVLGNAAFARCDRAERQASGPDGRPAAFDAAIAHAVAAQSAWQRAAASRDDWPQAR